MVPTSRRAYLTLLGTVAAGGVAGCLGSPTPATGGEVDNPNVTPSPSRATTKRTTASATPAAGPAEPVRCRGEPVIVDQTVSDEPGYDDDMKYFPSNRTVRIVTVRSGDEPRGFAEWSFAEWGTFETADVARPRAVAVTANRLGIDEFGSGVGRPPDSADTEDVVVWLHLTTHVEDGEVVSTPTLPLERLVEHAPRSVDATVTLEGDSFSRSVPVWADHSRMSFGGDGG